MGRQPKQYIGGVYLPHPRQAYGPRETVKDAKGQARRRRALLDLARPLEALDLLMFGVESVQTYTPGGRRGRVLWVCPLCGHRRARLYRVGSEDPLEVGVKCRLCAHLIYWSHREGRRAEADPDRLTVLLQRAEAEKAAGHRKRARQYLRKLATALSVRERRAQEQSAMRDRALDRLTERLTERLTHAE